MLQSYRFSKKVAVYTGFCRPVAGAQLSPCIHVSLEAWLHGDSGLLDCRVERFVKEHGNVILVPERLVNHQHRIFVVHDPFLSSGTLSVPGFQILFSPGDSFAEFRERSVDH